MTDPAKLYAQLTNAFSRRAWPRVVEVAAVLGPLAPRHPGLYYMSGVAHMELQRMHEAVEYLRRASVLEPQNPDFAVQYAKSLTMARRNVDAKVAADKAAKLLGSDPLAWDTLGVTYSQIGAYESSSNAFRRAVALAPYNPAYQYNLATSLVAAGNLNAAEQAIDSCLELDPKYWRAHLTLAQLRRQTPANNHVERLNRLISGLRASKDQSALVCLHMALAKELEDLNQYPRALKHFVLGKAAGAASRRYSIERDEALFQAITESFPQLQPTTPGYETGEPIFILGMPRSGTTLVERIVSSHPQVQSAGELLNFGMAIKHLSGSATGSLIDLDTVHQSRNLDWTKLGEMYLTSTRPVTGQKQRFIDKLPHNFLYAGWIASALPKATIICLRRNPVDTCLSNFRQLFAPKSPYFDYSFDLLDTGRYYVLFDRLMKHWQRVLPGRILEVHYETLVVEQERTSRQIIQFCRLPWDDRCLQFERNPAPVATASAVQVRAPMYRDALQRWKKYGATLNPLIELLRDAEIEGID